MAWSSSALVTGEANALAADYPVLIGVHAGAHPQGFLPIWTDGSGTMVEADESDDETPAYFGSEYGAHRLCAPDAAVSSSTWYYVIDATRSTNAIDCFALINHNLDGVGSISCRVDIADNTTFSTNLVTGVVTFTPSGTRNLVFASTRYSGGGYIRFRFTAAGNFTPAIGELWAGRRRQLNSGLMPGSDVEALATTLSVSPGVGAEIVAGKAIGRRIPTIELLANQRTATLQDVTTLREWWEEIDFGRRPFLFCAAPASAPDAFMLLRSADTALEFTRASAFEYTISRNWVELPPFLSGAG